jgi:LysM repeat protein
MVNAFTFDEVKTMAVRAGFTTSESRIAAAIAFCEAPYSANGKQYADCDLVGDQALANATWGNSYGFFQIRSLRADYGKGTARDQLALTDPVFNCWAALQIKNTQGWTAWSTYNSGAYKAYLQDIYPPPPGVYVVVYGDSLSRIATKVGKGTWGDWARVNGIRSPYTIFIGEKLLHPWIEHTVVSGETLSGIVSTYGSGVTVARVATFNSISDPNKISVGQVIKIPNANL